jgi:CotH kinase protein
VVNLSDKYIFDKTLMYNYVGYELSRSIGKYASRCKFVELELNGEYLGVYVFMERLKRDSNRINIKSLNSTSTNNTGGYIITIDKASIGDAGIGKPLAYFDSNWDDDARYTVQNSFRSQYDINRNVLSSLAFDPPYHPRKYLETYFLYEYPKAEDITQVQKDYIAKYISQFETALINDDFSVSTRTYTNFIDSDTFVDYFIINELCRNVDAYRLSTYLQKDRDGKLSMGPVWDMDIAFDNGDRIPMNDWVINYNKYVTGDAWMMPFWWPRLLEDSQFKTKVKQRWVSLRLSQLSNANLGNLVNTTATYLKSNGAVKRNYEKWDKGIGVNYDASIENLRLFLLTRAEWMDATISQF